MQAQLNLEEVNERLNLQLPLTDEYQTLGGFLLFQLQKIPQPGETLRYEDWEFTVISAEGPRLHQIQIHQLDAAAATLEAEPFDDRELDNGSSTGSDASS